MLQDNELRAARKRAAFVCRTPAAHKNNIQFCVGVSLARTVWLPAPGNVEPCRSLVTPLRCARRVGGSSEAAVQSASVRVAAIVPFSPFSP
jgi:hypothetical protein